MNNLKSIFTGSKLIQVKDETHQIDFPVLIHYPTLQPSSPTNFGPYILDVSVEADLMEGEFPLVIISHGNSGSYFLYRTISTYLAKQGYIVAMIEHYGNNRNNNALEKTIENLRYRPFHVSLTIDALLVCSFGKHIDNEKIAVIGHSFGGYTALALAGGIPYTQAGERVDTVKDARLKALVLMAPAAPYFMHPHSLEQVNIPILLLIAEKDAILPKIWTEDIIRQGVADATKLSSVTIKNAGHFSFISPFPASMTQPGFLPATDLPEFNRAAFHEELPVLIYDFLKINLEG